jgi:hypothetical protein
MHNYRKHKAQEEADENKTQQASMSTDPTPASIIYNYNQAKIFLKEQLGPILTSIWSWTKCRQFILHELRFVL